MAVQWAQSGEYEDIVYETTDGIAKITINRPQVRNAFRPETVNELIDAFHHAHHDPGVGVIILTGEGAVGLASDLLGLVSLLPARQAGRGLSQESVSTSGMQMLRFRREGQGLVWRVETRPIHLENSGGMATNRKRNE